MAIIDGAYSEGWIAPQPPATRTAEAHDLLGAPTRRRPSKPGDLESVVESWETTDSVTEVTFVGGVVVKFTSSSK